MKKKTLHTPLIFAKLSTIYETNGFILRIQWKLTEKTRQFKFLNLYTIFLNTYQRFIVHEGNEAKNCCGKLQISEKKVL